MRGAAGRSPSPGPGRPASAVQRPSMGRAARSPGSGAGTSRPRTATTAHSASPRHGLTGQTAPPTAQSRRAPPVPVPRPPASPGRSPSAAAGQRAREDYARLWLRGNPLYGTAPRRPTSPGSHQGMAKPPMALAPDAPAPRLRPLAQPSTTHPPPNFGASKVAAGVDQPMPRSPAPSRPLSPTGSYAPTLLSRSARGAQAVGPHAAAPPAHRPGSRPSLWPAHLGRPAGNETAAAALAEVLSLDGPLDSVAGSVAGSVAQPASERLRAGWQGVSMRRMGEALGHGLGQGRGTPLEGGQGWEQGEAEDPGWWGQPELPPPPVWQSYLPGSGSASGAGGGVARARAPPPAAILKNKGRPRSPTSRLATAGAPSPGSQEQRGFPVGVVLSATLQRRHQRQLEQEAWDEEDEGEEEEEERRHAEQQQLLHHKAMQEEAWQWQQQQQQQGSRQEHASPLFTAVPSWMRVAGKGGATAASSPPQQQQQHHHHHHQGLHQAPALVPAAGQPPSKGALWLP